MVPPLTLAVLFVASLGSSEVAASNELERLVRTRGASIGLELSGDSLLFHRFKPRTGGTAREALDASRTGRVVRYLSLAPEAGLDRWHAESLRSFLKTRPDSGLGAEAFDAGGAKLSPLGRNLLVDLVTAEDGTTLGPVEAAPSGSVAAAIRLSGFDWERFSTLGREEALKRYAADQGRETVRLLVDGRGFGGVSEIEALGGSLVRNVSDVMVVEVPLEKAATLGRALRDRGVDSRPAAAYVPPKRISPPSPALPKTGPAPSALGTAFAPGSFSIKNAQSRSRLGVEDLWLAGMTGKGAVAAVIDTGIDLKHPDFKDKVSQYVDLTGEGLTDVLGHGTHVAGSVAGTGAASDGLHRGMAPDAKLLVFKVFDKEGRTTEDIILAAMHQAAAMGANVINLSLGGPGDPEADALSRLANHLVVRRNVLVVSAAGNSGPLDGTVSAPGNAEFALGVTGVDKNGEFPFFTSRGPVASGGGRSFVKPDLSAVAGGVSFVEPEFLVASAGGTDAQKVLLQAPQDGRGAGAGRCVYEPGVVSPMSESDPESVCAVPGLPGYRYMSGTSMAAPMATGIAADVVGYLVRRGIEYRAFEVKAAMMETAADLGKAPEVQGAGLIQGKALAAAVAERAARGLPIGNVAAMLAARMTSDQRGKLGLQARYRWTAVGLWDESEGRLVNDDAALKRAAAEIDALVPPAVARIDDSRTAS